MSDTPNPDPDRKDPLVALLWLGVGLAPIVILLAAISSSRGNATFGGIIFIVCALCNLLGGIGCLRGIKDVGLRILLGVFLAGFFFVLSWGVALFQACSHMGGSL